ncbi:S-layer homology domain-containing protein [Anaerotignum sp. MB30-C6]|uniref:S-layer homology domain-containing protein n=1 Tax=Anaerotignum sp. MB30-C6 TaxID=3070814 RepID=UPI0027DCD8A6|nr:S-layer homology domain-containing protein [Anaerotignum sp. MB30-C6]WMI80501.1 S-layer homology domain-containing protein [Anaerotignum sp. MB30-C6]
MNKKLTVLFLSVALACTISVPAMASMPANLQLPIATSKEEPLPLPSSVLYYGKIHKIIANDSGQITKLHLNSERYGEYVMNITSETIWVDSGNHRASDPSDLQVGEGIYVFYSPRATSSFPPQSAALVVVRNIPQDVAGAQYHIVEAVTKGEDESLKITTNNGGLIILADKETNVSPYLTKNILTADDIQVGDGIMAWYGFYATIYPAQTHASHIMLLPQKDPDHTKILTRSALVALLYDMAGKPDVNDSLDFTDVNDRDANAHAIRWATSEHLVSGYVNGSFGVDDTVTREQLLTILWRYAGRPVLMDYEGLTQYSDAKDISPYARHAMAWAHQMGIVSVENTTFLAPKGSVTKGKAVTILDSFFIQG